MLLSFRHWERKPAFDFSFSCSLRIDLSGLLKFLSLGCSSMRRSNASVKIGIVEKGAGGLCLGLSVCNELQRGSDTCKFHNDFSASHFCCYRQKVVSDTRIVRPQKIYCNDFLCLSSSRHKEHLEMHPHLSSLGTLIFFCNKILPTPIYKINPDLPMRTKMKNEISQIVTTDYTTPNLSRSKRMSLRELSQDKNMFGMDWITWHTQSSMPLLLL